MAKVSHKGRQIKNAVDGSGVAAGAPTGPAMIPPGVAGGTYKTYPGAGNQKPSYSPQCLLINQSNGNSEFGPVSTGAPVAGDLGGACGIKSGQDYGK